MATVSKKMAIAIAAIALQAGPSCESDLEAPSEVTNLRVLAVGADPSPYVRPGDEVTLRLTYHDSLGNPPRPIEMTWIAGCVLPSGSPFALCAEQLQNQFGSGADPTLVTREVLPPEQSGVPDAVKFTTTIPEDVFELAGAEDENSLVAYVFFTACAGEVRPEAPDSEAQFPLGCFNADGSRVPPSGFVPGYTEVYIFKDDRTNANPPIGRIELGDAQLSTTREAPTEIPRCIPVEEEAQGCEAPKDPKAACMYELNALIDDVAEPDPAASSTGLEQDEVIWVDYYAEAGDLDDDRVLVSAATEGYRTRHDTVWTAPEAPGTFSIWAVVHDSRGGSNVTRAFVRVE